jgi:hypothetical protein
MSRNQNKKGEFNMRKHKSVVAVLLAVMMIFTFMPTMSFAAKATGWGDKYGTVSDENDTYKTERVQGSDGLITATATDEKTVTVVGGAAGTAPSDEYADPATRYFYDLDDSVLVYDGNAKNLLDKATVTKDYFDTLADHVYVRVVKPSYEKTYDAKADPVYTLIPLSGFEAHGWTATLTTSPEKYDNDKAVEDQQFTVSVEFAPRTVGAVMNGTRADLADKFGVVATAQITVKGTAVTPATAEFFWDAKDGANLNYGNYYYTAYDGAAHTLSCDEVSGYTVSYEVYNATTGKYESVSAVSLTDVNVDKDGNPKALQVRVTFKKGTTDTQYRNLYVNLMSGVGAALGFDLSASEDDDDCEYLVPGTDYDGNSYLVVKAEQTDTKNVTDPKAKAYLKAVNAATKKAVAANESLIKEWFNDYYEVKGTVRKSSSYMATLKIEEKELTDKEEEALDKKYAALYANVGKPAIINDTDLGIKTTAAVYFSNGEYDYEVEFTKAPAGVKTYKAKKSTKKLAKNKTFTVKAVAKDKATVKYKLKDANSYIKINSTTGKITVKKGLKKGTYTFKVKAYVPGNHAKYVASDYEYQTVKVKIK